MRKGEQAREEMVKDVNGQILRDGVEVRRRWEEYFEQVLNVTDVREANINVLLLLLLKKIGNARPGEGDCLPISQKTPAPHYQPIEEKKRKGK